MVGAIRNSIRVIARAGEVSRARRAVAMALARRRLRRCCRCRLRSGSMRPGAERRHAGGQFASFDRRIRFDDRFPQAAVQGPLPERRTRAFGQLHPMSDLHRQTHGAGRSPHPTGSPRWRRSCPTSARRRRGSDHAGQPEILGLSLFGNNPRIGRAVPQHLQGRRRGHRSYSAAGSTGRTRPTTTTAC